MPGSSTAAHIGHRIAAARSCYSVKEEGSKEGIIGGIIRGIIGVVILLLLCRLMVVGKILILENLGVGTLPTPPN